MTIGQRIKQRREELGLSQQELATRLGYKSKVSISNVENDRDDMTTTRVQKYAKALETTSAYLMGWDEVADIKLDFGTTIEKLEQHSVEYLHNYVDCFNRAAIKELLNVAKDCSDKQIDLATEMLKSMKKIQYQEDN